MELVQRLVLRKGVKSMKKQYVKPELYFENFELSTSIAACAYTDATHQDGNTCAYSTTGGTIFSTSPDPCAYTPDNLQSKICYDISNANQNIFGGS